MPYEIVPVTDDNVLEMHRLAHLAFGAEFKEERAEDERLIMERDRMIAVADGADLVATAGAYSFELTLPGDEVVPMAGVTWVACLPTHRRRGILTQMMRHQLDDVASRGESLAGLTASEAVIYNRFGYGVATQTADVKLRKRRVAFRRDSTAGGRLRIVSGDEPAKILPPIFDEWRRHRAGAVHRSEGRWEQYLRDREFDRKGASGLVHVVHEDDDHRPDGYVTYRVKDNDPDENTVMLIEVIAHDPEVETALWQYLFDIDLTDRYVLEAQPVDATLPWRLVDHRAYHCNGIWDFLWIRVVDTPAALAARRYATSGSLVIEVVDAFRPDGAAAGRFRLDGGPDGATCTREAAAAADITLPVESLGSVYLGGARWTTLAAAGRASGSPEALRRADAMFVQTPLPFCNTGF